MLAPPSLLTSLSPSNPLPRDLMRPCTSFTLVSLVYCELCTRAGGGGGAGGEGGGGGGGGVAMGLHY